MDIDEILKNKKVLIVDDNEANVTSLRLILKRKVGEILTAENGQIGLDILAENSDIDIVLMDIMMPVMDGYQAIGHIRKQEDLSKKPLPIIAVTAKADAQDEIHCLTIGADSYMRKPVQTQELFKSMATLLSS